MSEIISPDSTELLTYVLGEVHNKSYVDAVRNVQQQITDNAELIDVPVIHHFAPGVYMRQMDAAAGTLVVSKMHRTEHFIMFLTGSCSVLTDDGVELIKAPCVLRTMPGTKRVGYFHEDTSCITIHPTDSKDLVDIEKQVIVPEEEVDQFLATIQNQFKEIAQ